VVVECDGRLAIGHQGFWNAFSYHVPCPDLTVGGGIRNHDSTNGLRLVRRIVAVVAATGRGAGGTEPKKKAGRTTGAGGRKK
jgi:hypothetical protein